MTISSNQDITKSNLRVPNLRLKAFTTPNTIGEDTQQILEHYLHYSRACGNLTEAAKILRALEVYNLADANSMLLNDAQSVFIRVARELAGLATPNITSNPIVKAIQPLELKDGHFLLSHHIVLIALGKDINSKEDFKITRQQVSKQCFTLFAIEDGRNTWTFTLPGAEEKFREKSYTYKVSLQKVLEVAQSFQGNDAAQTDYEQLEERKIDGAEESNEK
jgi:hypothetical protein